MMSHNNVEYLGDIIHSNVTMKNIEVNHNKLLSDGMLYESTTQTEYDKFYTNNIITIENMLMYRNTGVRTLCTFESDVKKRITLSLINVTIISSERRTRDLPVMRIFAMNGNIRIKTLSLSLQNESYNALEILYQHSVFIDFKEFDVFMSCPIGSNTDVGQVYWRSKNSMIYNLKCKICAANY